MLPHKDKGEESRVKEKTSDKGEREIERDTGERGKGRHRAQ